MPGRPFTVTTNPQLVPGSNNGFDSAVSVTNIGGATVYLSDVQQCDTTEGWPLNPQATVVWDAGLPLWVVSPTSSSIVVTPNTGSVFDPGAIADQLLLSGLAGDIAAAISLEGVPPIDRPVILVQDSRTLASGAAVTLPMEDVSPYASLMLGYGETGASGAGTLLRFIQFNWFADAGGTLAIGSDAILPSVDGGRAVGQIAVRGPFVQIVYNAVATAGASDLVLTVAGSFRSLDHKRVRCDSALASTVTVVRLGASDGLSIAAATTAAGPVTYDWYPWSWAGQVRINVNVSAVAAVSAVDLIDMSSGKVVCRVTLPVSASSAAYIAECWVPAMQYQVKLTANGAAFNYVITLQQEGAA